MSDEKKRVMITVMHNVLVPNATDIFRLLWFLKGCFGEYVQEGKIVSKHLSPHF